MQASLRTRVLRVLHYNAARSGWRNPGDQCDHAGRLLLAGRQLRRNIVTASSHVGALARTLLYFAQGRLHRRWAAVQKNHVVSLESLGTSTLLTSEVVHSSPAGSKTTSQPLSPKGSFCAADRSLVSLCWNTVQQRLRTQHSSAL